METVAAGDRRLSPFCYWKRASNHFHRCRRRIVRPECRVSCGTKRRFRYVCDRHRCRSAARTLAPRAETGSRFAFGTFTDMNKQKWTILAVTLLLMAGTGVVLARL